MLFEGHDTASSQIDDHDCVFAEDFVLGAVTQVPSSQPFIFFDELKFSSRLLACLPALFSRPVPIMLMAERK